MLSAHKDFQKLFSTNSTVTALAPMQAITDLPFMRVIQSIGAPDCFFTEYFRVHEASRLEKHILACITGNTSGKPLFAQLMGEDIPALKRAVQELQQYPITGIDLNMGCPAPKIYKKNVGGGLLRDLAKVDSLLGELRACCKLPFTVKMRIGFDSTEAFGDLLALVAKHQIDCLSLHARTVKELYGPHVQYEYIAQAVNALSCPVLANGDLTSVNKITTVLAQTQAAGAMIGRAAIRNPWIFRQLREYDSGITPYQPTLSDIYAYIQLLYDATAQPDQPEGRHINALKKFLTFVGVSVDPEGLFLKAIRLVSTAADLFAVCQEHLLAEGKHQRFFALEPYLGLVARPNRESTCSCALTAAISL